MLGYEGGVPGEGIHNVTVQPAALVLQGAGKIPVVEGDHGLDTLCQQGVYQVVVENKALFVDGAVPVGDNPGPADGETVGPDIVGLHQIHVLLPAVVAVAGDVAGIPVLDVVVGRVMAEVVPDVGAFSVLVPGTLALVGGAGYAPQEVLGKCAHTVTSTLYSGLPVSGICLPGMA